MHVIKELVSAVLVSVVLVSAVSVSAVSVSADTASPLILVPHQQRVYDCRGRVCRLRRRC